MKVAMACECTMRHVQDVLREFRDAFEQLEIKRLEFQAMRAENEHFKRPKDSRIHGFERPRPQEFTLNDHASMVAFSTYQWESEETVGDVPRRT